MTTDSQQSPVSYAHAKLVLDYVYTDPEVAPLITEANVVVHNRANRAYLFPPEVVQIVTDIVARGDDVARLTREDILGVAREFLGLPPLLEVHPDAQQSEPEAEPEPQPEVQQAVEVEPEPEPLPPPPARTPQARVAPAAARPTVAPARPQPAAPVAARPTPAVPPAARVPAAPTVARPTAPKPPPAAPTVVAAAPAMRVATIKTAPAAPTTQEATPASETDPLAGRGVSHVIFTLLCGAYELSARDTEPGAVERRETLNSLLQAYKRIIQ